MTNFKGFDFNEFVVVENEYKKLPRLTTTRGAFINDWSFSGGITPVWEDGKHGMSLRQTDDETQMEEFEEQVSEFNEESTQAEWDDFYKETKNNVISYYKREIKEATDKLDKLLADE